MPVFPCVVRGFGIFKSVITDTRRDLHWIQSRGGYRGAACAAFGEKKDAAARQWSLLKRGMGGGHGTKKRQAII